MMMDAMKRIMVAVGFADDYTEGLLKYAAQISQSLNAELIVASIINSRDVEAVSTIAAMGYEVDSTQYVAGIKEERQQALDEILKKISFPAEKARTMIKIGHPAQELLKMAVNEKVDLVIMGIKGRSDLEYLLVGSVAEKVFRRSPVPILSYRDEKNAERLRKHILQK
jgi:nucleotide-binding universal stress UspA family protein